MRANRQTNIQIEDTLITTLMRSPTGNGEIKLFCFCQAEPPQDCKSALLTNIFLRIVA